MKKPSKPIAGDVFRYPFLWKRQQLAGETAGRKSRPVCIAVTTAAREGETILFIVAITTKPPQAGRAAIAVPQIEAKRIKLDAHAESWIMLDEVNTDVLERSYTFEDRTPLGSFSPAFTTKVRAQLLALAERGEVVVIKRT